MGEIALYQRSELPPSSGGQALIPESLADNSGAIKLGNAITEVSTNWMGKILDAQRDTEISNASVAIQNQKAAYDKWLTDNPDQADDEMHNATQFNKMFGDEFKSQLVKSTKNKDAQRIVGLHVNEYSASFKEHAQKQAGAMVTQQNADSLQNNLELYTLDKNKEGVDKIIDIGLGNKVIRDKDQAEMIRRDAYAKIDAQIDAENKEQIKSNVEMTAFQIAKDKGYDEAEKWLRDPQTELDLLKLGAKREDVKSLLVDIEERVGDQKTQEKEITVSKQQEIGNDIFNSFQSKDLTKARELINSGKDGIQLEPTGENSKQYWSNILNSAKVEAENPYADTTDDDIYLEVANAISGYREGTVGRDEAYKMLTKNKAKLEESDYKSLRSVFDNDMKADSPLKSDIHKQYSDVVQAMGKAKMFSSNKVENARIQAKADTLLDKWTLKNPDADIADYDAFFAKLQDISSYQTNNVFSGEAWFQDFHREKAEQQRYIPRNIENMESELGGTEDISKMSDAELLKRITGQ